MSAERLLPLSGVIAVVLTVASFAAAGTTPTATATPEQVASFYSRNLVGQTISGSLLSVGALFFLVFSAQIFDLLRNAQRAFGGCDALCFAGSIVLVVALAIIAGLSIAISDLTGHVGASAIQILNLLTQDAVVVYPTTIGTTAFLLGAGIGVLTSSVLPRWLGWFALLFSVFAAIPSHVFGGILDHIGFVGLAGLGVWTLVVSIQLTRTVSGHGVEES